MRVIAHLMGAEGKHISGNSGHDFELVYPDGRVARGDEMMWGWTPPGRSQKYRESPILGTTTAVYSGQEWQPDADLAEMALDGQVQKHIEKVSAYPTEEKHLAIRAYSPLTSIKSLINEDAAAPVRPVITGLVQHVTNLWVLTDYVERVMHLTQGVWTMEPMPYLWPKIFGRKPGPNASKGWPTRPGPSWVPPL